MTGIKKQKCAFVDSFDFIFSGVKKKIISLSGKNG
jgi:hypothetical protein